MAAVDTGLWQRVQLAVLGALAGFAAYALIEDRAHFAAEPQIYLVAVSFGTVFFGAILALIGQMRIWRAAGSAVVLALPVAALTLWAGQRYAPVTDVLSSPPTMIAFLLLATLPLPFLIAAAGKGWRHYPTLFISSWSIVVRYAAAWIFVGAFWMLLWLSDALLQIAGIELMRWIDSWPAAPWMLSGLALGLGLAVVDELADYISPYLALRLVRVFVPVLLLVSLVFLVNLPIAGLGKLYGGLSSGGILLSMALLAAGLVSVALDEDDREAVRGRLLCRCAEALALILPVLAVLGALGLRQQVLRDGWTPWNLASVLTTAVALGYGAIYAGAVIWPGPWRARVRRGNIVMALLVILIAALWMTPVLNAPKIAAQDILARYTSGRIPAARVDLRMLRSDLGKPGQAVLEHLRKLSQTQGHEALKAQLAQLSTPGDIGQDPETQRRALKEILPVMQATAEGGKPVAVAPGQPDALRDAVLQLADRGELKDWLEGCKAVLSDGRPGCVLVEGRFLLELGGPQAVLFFRTPYGTLRMAGFSTQGGAGLVRNVTLDTSAPGQGFEPAATTIDRLLDGDFSLKPAPVQVLDIGSRQIGLRP